MGSVFDAAAARAARDEFYARTTVEICSPDYTPQGLLRDWDSVEAIDRYGDVGQGQLECAGSDWNRELVQPGATVIVRRDGEVIQAGPLEFEEELRGNSVSMPVSWKDQNVYLDERLVWPDPTSEISGTGAPVAKATDDRLGYTTSVIIGYVNGNCGPGALSFRRAPGLTMGADPGAGVYLDVPVQARYDNLLTLMRQLAITGAVAFAVNTNDRTHTFNCWQIENLADDVVFSAQTHNVADSKFSAAAPTATAVIVGGKGEDILRSFAFVTSPDSLVDAATWRYVEAFRDDRSADGASMIAGAQRDLSEKGSTISATFTPTNTGLKYGRDYRLGDLVMCILRPGLSVIKPVREVTRTYSVANGYQVVPVAGDYGATSSTGEQFHARELIRTVAALKATR